MGYDLTKIYFSEKEKLTEETRQSAKEKKGFSLVLDYSIRS